MLNSFRDTLSKDFDFGKHDFRKIGQFITRELPKIIECSTKHGFRYLGLDIDHLIDNNADELDCTFLTPDGTPFPEFHLRFILNGSDHIVVFIDRVAAEDDDKAKYSDIGSSDSFDPQNIDPLFIRYMKWETKK